MKILVKLTYTIKTFYQREYTQLFLMEINF